MGCAAEVGKGIEDYAIVKPPAVSCQPSAVSHQLSAIRRQPFDSPCCHPVYNEVGVVKAHCGGDAVGAWFLTFLIPQRLGF